LIKEIKENRFREDLFYRLNVFRIKIPPLRERKEDIYELVPFFIHQISFSLNKKVAKITDGYYKILFNYDWPGNIRELKNAVHYSLATLNGEILSEEHLAGFFGQSFIESKIEEQKGSLLDRESPKKLSELEKIAIQESLHIAKGNKTKASKILGISRASIYRKLKNIK
jgi:transcriptional regulator with PAS, ATPase and Fis domain